MDKMPGFTAIVGSSFAGKSTLLVNLHAMHDLKPVTTISEYCTDIGGNRNFRRIPFVSNEDAEANINDFIGWELQRQQLACQQSSSIQPVVMDRTIYCFLLTQLLLLKYRPEWFNAFDYGINAIATELSIGRLVLPRRLILLEPTDEATFIKRSERGVSVDLFKRPTTWKFFSRCYRLIIERLYGKNQSLILYSSDMTDSKSELTNQALSFIFENQSTEEVTMQKFLETFIELRDLSHD